MQYHPHSRLTASPLSSQYVRVRNKGRIGLAGAAPCLGRSVLHTIERAQGKMQTLHQTAEGCSCKRGGACVTVNMWRVCQAPLCWGKSHEMTLQGHSCLCQRGLVGSVPLSGRLWEVFSFSLPLCSALDQHSSGNCGCASRGRCQVCLRSGVVP